MKTRQSVVRKDYSIASDGTHIFDIVGDEPISRLVINPKVTNPNAYVAVGHPDEILSKIEIVDGSDVIFSCEGTQAKAVAFYGTKKQPVSAMNYMALQWSFSPIEIYFGRFLFDPEFALDPMKFNNLQVKVTTVIAGAMTSTTVGSIDIVADIMTRDYSDPKGLLIAKEIIALDTIASAVNYTDLPTDYPIRLLLGVCFSDTQAPEYNISTFELYEGNRKNLLISYDMEDYQAIMAGIFPKWSEKIYGGLLTTDRNFWITPAFERVAVIQDYNEQNAVTSPESTGGQKLIASAEAACIFEGTVEGWAPHGSCPFVFPGVDVPEAYWDLSGVSGTLKTTFHASVDTTPTYDVIAQQLRMY